MSLRWEEEAMGKVDVDGSERKVQRQGEGVSQSLTVAFVLSMSELKTVVEDFFSTLCED